MGRTTEMYDHSFSVSASPKKRRGDDGAEWTESLPIVRGWVQWDGHKPTRDYGRAFEDQCFGKNVNGFLIREVSQFRCHEDAERRADQDRSYKDFCALRQVFRDAYQAGHPWAYYDKIPKEDTDDAKEINREPAEPFSLPWDTTT